VLHALCHLILQIKNLVGIPTVDLESAFVAIEDNAHATAFDMMTVAASPFPGDRPFLSELQCDDLCVGSFPIIIESISPTSGGHARRIVDVESPSREV